MKKISLILLCYQFYINVLFVSALNNDNQQLQEQVSSSFSNNIFSSIGQYSKQIFRSSPLDACTRLVLTEGRRKKPPDFKNLNRDTHSLFNVSSESVFSQEDSSVNIKLDKNQKKNLVDDMLSGKYWLFGIMFAIIGCFCTASGELVMKYSSLKNELLPIYLQRSALSRPLQQLSIFLLVGVHAPIDSIAQALVSASILQPLEAVTILIVTIGSVIFLGETLTLIDIKSSFLIISGAIVSVIFGTHSEQPLNAECVHLLLINFTTSQYFVIFVIVFIGIHIRTRHIRRHSPNKVSHEKNKSLTEFDDSEKQALLPPNLLQQEQPIVTHQYGPSSFYSTQLHPTMYFRPSPVFNADQNSCFDQQDDTATRQYVEATPRGFIPFDHYTPNLLNKANQNSKINRRSTDALQFAIYTGLVGSIFCCLSNSSVQLVTRTQFVNGQNQFKTSNTQDYAATSQLVVILSLILRIYQLWCLNRGLKFFDAMLFLPIYTAFLIVGGTATSLFFFDESSSLSLVHHLFFGLGCLLTIIGVQLLSHRSTAKTKLDQFQNCQSPCSKYLRKQRQVKKLRDSAQRLNVFEVIDLS